MLKNISSLLKYLFYVFFFSPTDLHCAFNLWICADSSKLLDLPSLGMATEDLFPWHLGQNSCRSHWAQGSSQLFRKSPPILLEGVPSLMQQAGKLRMRQGQEGTARTTAGGFSPCHLPSWGLFVKGGNEEELSKADNIAVSVACFSSCISALFLYCLSLIFLYIFSFFFLQQLIIRGAHWRVLQTTLLGKEVSWAVCTLASSCPLCCKMVELWWCHQAWELNLRSPVHLLTCSWRLCNSL